MNQIQSQYIQQSEQNQSVINVKKEVIVRDGEAQKIQQFEQNQRVINYEKKKIVIGGDVAKIQQSEQNKSVINLKKEEIAKDGEAQKDQLSKLNKSGMMIKEKEPQAFTKQIMLNQKSYLPYFFIYLIRLLIYWISNLLIGRYLIQKLIMWNISITRSVLKKIKQHQYQHKFQPNLICHIFNISDFIRNDKLGQLSQYIPQQFLNQLVLLQAKRIKQRSIQFLNMDINLLVQINDFCNNQQLRDNYLLIIQMLMALKEQLFTFEQNQLASSVIDSISSVLKQSQKVQKLLKIQIKDKKQQKAQSSLKTKQISKISLLLTLYQQIFLHFSDNNGIKANVHGNFGNFKTQLSQSYLLFLNLSLIQGSFQLIQQFPFDNSNNQGFISTLVKKNYSDNEINNNKTYIGNRRKAKDKNSIYQNTHTPKVQTPSRDDDKKQIPLDYENRIYTPSHDYHKIQTLSKRESIIQSSLNGKQFEEMISQLKNNKNEYILQTSNLMKLENYAQPFSQQPNNSQIQGFNYDNQSKSIDEFKKCTGLIQCVWKGKLGHTELVGYATAFAISPHIIITCAHAIYQPKRGRHCSLAYFIPFHGQTPVTTRHHIYQTMETDFLRFDQIEPNQTYSQRPLRKDYAVLILKRPYITESYLSLSPEYIKGQQLNIWGYPSKRYQLSTPREGTDFQRVDLVGELKTIKEQYILVHTMQTRGGHSGSPIVRVRNRDGKKSIKTVGIHTHRGYDNTNEGLLMTEELKDKLMSYARELAEIHKIDLDYFHMPYSSQTVTKYKKCIGFLKCVWKDKNNKTAQIQYKYGTAFAISSHIIITAAHNIYSNQEGTKCPCDEAYFIPIDQYNQVTQKDMYKTKPENFVKFQVAPYHTQSGVGKDFAVLILDKPYKADQYCKLDSNYQIGKQIRILGFPSASDTQILGNKLTRKELCGKLDKIQQQRLVYAMKAEAGQSGSPIFRVTFQNGKASLIVIGIHTTKCDNHCEGVLLTADKISKINNYAQELVRFHE